MVQELSYVELVRKIVEIQDKNNVDGKTEHQKDAEEEVYIIEEQFRDLATARSVFERHSALLGDLS